MKDKEGENKEEFKDVSLNASPPVEKKDSTSRKEEPTPQKEEPVKVVDNVDKNFTPLGNTTSTTSYHKDEVQVQEIKVTGEHHEGCCCVIL